MLLTHRTVRALHRRYLTMALSPSDFNLAKFRADLSVVLRHVAAADIQVWQGPDVGLGPPPGELPVRRSLYARENFRNDERVGGTFADTGSYGTDGSRPGGAHDYEYAYDDKFTEPAGWVNETGAKQTRRQFTTACPKFDGYSGGTCGDPVYKPIKNRGAITIAMTMYAHKVSRRLLFHYVSPVFHHVCADVNSIWALRLARLVHVFLKMSCHVVGADACGVSAVNTLMVFMVLSI
jgi:hypothetical protein